jgi:hypothetical protein
MPTPTITREERTFRAQHERAIREANEKVIAANALLEVRVIAARKAGCPWRVVAQALGIAHQSAMKRFKALPELADER